MMAGAATAPARPRDAPGRGRLAELARAAAAPVICAVVVTGMLSAWVVTGGAGTVTRVRVEIGLAAVPMRAYAASRASAIHAAPTYLTIRNLSNGPDVLLSVRSPVCARVVLTGPPGPHGGRPVLSSLAIPAHGSITLTPFGEDVVLMDPARYETDMTVPLTLTFRHAGQVHVDAAVTAPGAP
jgi:copper(I)-binding protein